MSPTPARQTPSATQEKVPTGIAGFDLISEGGLPARRSTLLIGTPGAGKTIWAMQFLAEGIRQFQEPGVFVTFEETPEDLRQNMIGLGWDLQQWEDEGSFRFVNAVIAGDGVEFVGEYDLEALVARVEHAVALTGAKRVSVDSIGSLLQELPSPTTVRQELNRLIRRLKAMDLTIVITAEQSEPTLHTVSEFVADNVVVLRNDLEEGKRRRTIEILKQRGSGHQKGQFSMALVPNVGVSVIPLSPIHLNQGSSNARISSGSRDLDLMLGGGLFQDSVVLVSGPTGSGKTLNCAHFVSANHPGDERPRLILAFEESHDQLVRNARSWGFDFEAAEARGDLVIACEYPEARSIEDHMIKIKSLVEHHRPSRLVVDSLTALERVCSRKAFREFVINLTSYVKQTRTASLFTATTPWLMGGESISETHISSMTDTIVLLRYVELMGEVRRGIAVLKMRGSAHENKIREFTINSAGLGIGGVFSDAANTLGGPAGPPQGFENERLNLIFPE